MSNYSFNIKQNDTSPTLSVIMADSTGTAISLASASVVFKMRAVNSTSLKVNASATITNASAGECSIIFPTDTWTAAGTFEGEIEMTTSAGKIQTVQDFVKFKVRDDFD